jgi:hypothetical protein
MIVCFECLDAGRLANGRKVVAEWNRHVNEALNGCGGHGCLRRASEEAQALLGPKGAVWSRRYDHRNESLVSCHEWCEIGPVSPDHMCEIRSVCVTK